MPWKKAALLGSIGFAAGGAICIAFILAGSPAVRAEDLPHILLGGLYGAVVMGGSAVYDIEHWSIARATATHFLLTFALYFLLVISMGWFTLDEPAFWIVVAVMLVGYICIWLIQYLSCRRKVRELNEDLKKWKSSEKAK